MHKFVSLVFFVLISQNLIISCKQNAKPKVFSENATVIFHAQKSVDSKLFGLKNWVTDEEKFDNNYTVKLSPDHKYGLGINFENLTPDAFVRVTVWKKGESAGNIALTSKAIGFHKYSSRILEKGENGWNKIILETFLPPNYNGEKVKVFMMNDKEKPAYFANIDVVVYDHKPYPSYEPDQTVSFIIKEKNINDINKNRIKSFKKGNITKKTKKEFDAIAVINGIEYPVTMRIKGDWLDHIQGNKWSFRVKMKEGNFKGMKEFSIQQPASRGYLNEYVLHRLLDHEDVLTTRYGFVPIMINGTSVGIYAFEEHFEKRLVEARKRREGPLLKFDEDPMWNSMKVNREAENWSISTPNVETAMILPFKKKKTMHNPSLKHQFFIAQNLLNQFRFDDHQASDLFKVNQLAKFYAIADIGISWHALRWHNERFYYDPLDSKLEYIAFDCYASSYIDHSKSGLTPDLILKSPVVNYDSYLSLSPFNDRTVLNEYLAVMSEYLFTDKLVNIIESDLPEIEKYETWINREYSFYHYDYPFIKNNIAYLQPRFNTLKEKLNNTELKVEVKPSKYINKNNLLIKGFTLQGFTKDEHTITVKNIHNQPLYLVGYSSKKKPESGIQYLEKPLRLNPFENLKQANSVDVNCLFTPNRIYFKTAPEDTLIFDVKVMPWPEPGHTSPRQELLKTALTETTGFATVNHGVIKFKSGHHVFKKPVIIPAGYRVEINSNTTLDFIEKAFFMSFSPVKIIGSPSNKVVIKSSDGTGMGFTVLDADSISELIHVKFDGWNTLNYQGWNLTGAVTFYESDVNISHTDFLNNHCEDALNIVRADFTLRHSLIAYTYSDGFDADFTTGLVDYCRFNQIGNDGIDYSGSEIHIENVNIDGAGDKGISGGEASVLWLKNVVISNANIGVASKDQSNLNIENIALNYCKCGFASYQKKPEYGPAILTINGYEMKDVKDRFIIGLGSVINLDGEVTEGKKKLNIDSLYAR